MTRRRIAVVDDDGAMVDILYDILEMHGWEPIRAHDGAEAVEIVVRSPVDVVLMDIRMPRMNGVQALEAIKRRAPETKVVLCTASASQDLITRALESGVSRILRKPVDAEVLLAVLDELTAA
ncbi:MAG: response regulator [Gemmatimonadota bacterium]